MNFKSGKSTALNMILLAIVFYGGFALVKHLGANFQAREIASEVKKRIALERGSYFTEAKGMDFIRQILLKKDVIFDEGKEGEVDVILNTEKQLIKYYFRYEVEINYLLFKSRRVFEIEDEMPSYS